MTKLLKYLLSLIVIVFSIQAGLSYGEGTWSVVTQPDIRSSVRDVFFLSDAQTGWFIAEDGMILKTMDGGITRETQLVGIEEDLNKVFFINDSTGWIVGENGTILKTKDGGITWHSQGSVNPTHDYNDIAVVSETHAIIVADEGRIVATTDGETWVEQTSGTSEDLYGVSCFGFNVAIAVGKNETILRTTDGGATWCSATTIPSIQGKDFNAVKMVSEKKAWLVGSGFPSPTNLKSVFALTEDGGDSWTVYLPREEVYENMWDIDFTNDTTGIAIGDGGVVFTTTNGMNWIQAPVGYGFDGKSVSLVGNDCWVCHYETIVKSEDFAQSWELLVNLTGHYLYDIFRIEESHFIAIGDNSSKLESTDGGYTWKPGYIVADNHTTRLEGIYFINSDTGWVVGAGSFVAKTENGGKTWHHQNVGMEGVWFRDAFFVNDMTGWVVGRVDTVGDQKVFKTIDGGNTWFEQTGLPKEILYAIFMLDENNGVIGGADNTLYYTNDGGTTWNLASFMIEGEKDINRLFFIDTSQGWAVGENGLVLFSSDGGVTWINQTSNTTNELEDIFFRNVTDGWIVGEKGLILATTDGGATWNVQGDGLTTYRLCGIAPKHGSILWVAGEKGTILKYVDDKYVTKSNIKMNEIFYNAFRMSELECQYIELYNAGSEVEYLNGMILCRLSKGDIDYVTYIWQFPGNGTDYSIQPGEYKIVTPDAKHYTDLDLSKADFECYVEGEFNAYDNPDVPNLINLKSLSDLSHKSEFFINYRSDVVILGSGKDVYWQDGIDIETIIDGVEYDNKETNKQTLNDLVDAGHAVGPSSNYQGRSVERKEPGMDTNNSTNDFRMTNVPTPWNIAPSYTITGDVNYYSNNKSVADATMNLTGIPNFSTQTGADGKFMFEYLIDGDFVLTGEKSDDLVEAVDPFDASLVLQYAVGEGSLTPAQKIAGDVTQNGEITAFDASYILRKYVGVLTEFPTGKDWIFVPTSFALDETNWSMTPNFLEYKPLNSNQFDQDFMAFAYGDVSGNWGETTLAKTYSIANINFGPETNLSDNTISIAINIEQPNLIVSGGFKINFDNEYYRVVAIRPGEILDGTQLVSEVNGGVIAFAFARAYPIQGNGVIASLDLEGLKDHTTSSKPFEFIHISLNEGSIKTHVNGQPLYSDANTPHKYALKQNYPNPFNPVTSITFDLPKSTKVTIKVYDILGREVATLIDKPIIAGSHSIQYDASNLASGVYFYQIRTKEFTSVKKMILLR